jgi:hypothetical protein
MRDWWLRTLLVLRAPRPVFVALRDESEQSISDRAEPVLAIVLLAGIAVILWTPTAAHLLDDHDYDGGVLVIWVWFFGALYGTVSYWLLGALLHAGVKALGSHGTYRRSRQILAFASVPIAASLLLWPFKLALYGGDSFRRGGSDAGTGGKVFAVLALGCVLWSIGLLLVGTRAVHGWTWGRAAAALTPLAAVFALGAVFSFL